MYKAKTDTVKKYTDFLKILARFKLSVIML